MNLNKNFIKELEKRHFKGLNNLEYLNLSENIIESINKGSFEILKQLKDRCLSIDKNGQVTLTDEFKKFLKEHLRPYPIFQ